jgi:hypothetical protein
MPDEKDAQFEETKWWIDRGPVKEREKPAAPVKGIVEQWATELLKGYNQDLATKNLVDINSKILGSLAVAPGEWERGTSLGDRTSKRDAMTNAVP